jgi:hypothetical protein
VGKMQTFSNLQGLVLTETIRLELDDFVKTIMH